MSIVSNSIINADAEARYLSPGELDQIKSFVAGGGVVCASPRSWPKAGSAS